MRYAVDYDGPIAVRFPRGSAFVSSKCDDTVFEAGISPVIKQGKDIAIITVGNMFEEAKKAVELLEKESVYPTVIDARFIKPIDKQMIENIAKDHKAVVVVEEAIKKGGYGEAVTAYVHERKLNTTVHIMAIDDRFVEQGKVSELRERLGLNHKKIYEKVLELTK